MLTLPTASNNYHIALLFSNAQSEQPNSTAYRVAVEPLPLSASLQNFSRHHEISAKRKINVTVQREALVH